MTRPSLSRRFRRSDRGALLVEFAVILPILILLFGIIVEGGRMMWSYQTAAAGVRDAARYLGRVVPSDLCDTTISLDGYEANLKSMIETNFITKGSVMPSLVTITALEVTRESCTEGFRVPKVAIVRVDATMNIDLPFKGMLEIVGGRFPEVITTVITDRTRAFGA